MKTFAAISLAAAACVTGLGTPSALAATASADMLIDALPGFVIEVKPTGGVGDAEAADLVEDPQCRKQMQEALVHIGGPGFQAMLKRANETQPRYAAFTEVAGLPNSAQGIANVDAWRRVMTACPEVSLGNLKQQLRPIPIAVQNVDAQVAYSWYGDDMPSPQPIVQFTTAGIMGKIEVIPTGDAQADNAFLTRLAQQQVDRINARRS